MNTVSTELQPSVKQIAQGLSTMEAFVSRVTIDLPHLQAVERWLIDIWEDVIKPNLALNVASKHQRQLFAVDKIKIGEEEFTGMIFLTTMTGVQGMLNENYALLISIDENNHVTNVRAVENVDLGHTVH